MTVQATITIIRAGHTFQQSLVRDGSIVMLNGRIDADRARQIVAANPEGHAVDGQLTFDAPPASWTWQATITFEDHDDRRR